VLGTSISLCFSPGKPGQFFAYPGNAGHVYGTNEKQGFRNLVVEGSKGIEIVDNPRWLTA
jgi:hypothetical protein